MPPKIVILDGKYANPGDLDWGPVSRHGETVIHPQSTPEEVVARSAGADILVINKVRLGTSEFHKLPDLRLICITATGTDNVDIELAKGFGIEVKNAIGYSTHSVAQHVFSLILHFTNGVAAHNTSVHAGQWDANKGFSYTLETIPDLSEKSIGIVGLGKIGKRVAEVSSAFGMKVFVTSGHANPQEFPHYEFVDIEQLFSLSDIVSLHAPLTENSKGMVNAQLLAKMKPGALLINTARGGLINEGDLYTALKAKKIKVALDVLQTEPPGTNHLFFGLDSCIITPHMAWTSLAARRELIRITGENIGIYLKEKRPGNS